MTFDPRPPLARLLAACLLLAGGALPAQVPIKPADPVNVEISLFAWSVDLPAMRYSPRHKIDAVESFMRSPASPYAGPPTLSFYPASSSLRPENGLLPPPIATATIPAGVSRLTLITVPGPTHGSYRMLAVPEDGTDLPDHTARLHNFTAIPLAVAYDANSVVQIPPAGSANIHPQGNATVIRVARQENGRWTKLFNNVVELNADGRANIILAGGPGRPVQMYSLPPWPRSLKPAATEPD